LAPLSDILQRYREQVERALELLLNLPGTPAGPLHEAMRYATLGGGKRIRASLVYAAGEALGAQGPDLDVPACAVELVHSYSLVHDDLPCMDNDDLRRGRPSCHRAFDEATALLAGDALQSLAFELLASDDRLRVTADRRLRMIATLAQAIGARGMAGGQAIDLAAVGRRLRPEELEVMHQQKTGALIRAAVMLGALSAPPAPEALMSGLSDYGEAMGLAFQIVDDILDVEGETARLGKTAGADRARDKPTYPSILGLEGAKARAQELHARALVSLRPLGDNSEVLAGIADFILQRAQ